MIRWTVDWEKPVILIKCVQNTFFVFLLNNNDICLYTIKSMPKKKSYKVPEMRVLPIFIEQIICASTRPGENEGIDYEEWGNL